MASSSSSCILSMSIQPLSSFHKATSLRLRPSSAELPTAIAAISSSKVSLASKWREVQGSDNWRDLIDPLNPLLRSEILRYGELVAACYKAFDLDPSSSRHLSCKYGKQSMFRDVGMEAYGYNVTKYIYAATDISAGACRSRWVGYVAVSSDEESRRIGRRDVLVSFRGTATLSEWIANLMSSLTPARLDPHDPRSNVKVESGFLSLYTSDESLSKFSHGSCREQLLSEVARIIKNCKNQELSITLAGHSMGSSLALLLGYDLAELGLNRGIPTTVYSFGGPRVGNTGFKKRCDELGVKVLRVVNVNDPVTKLPGVLLNEKVSKYGMPWSCSCYAHVGVELSLSFFDSQNPVGVHDLEAYLRFVKLPKKMKAKKDVDKVPLLASKVKRLLSVQNLDSWQWHDAARHVGDLVQSLGF